jgi:predicted MPP superfamily phosphohydrolase
MRIFSEKQPVILLSHTPLVFDRIDSSREIFMLAGDTHGGQMPLPAYLWKFVGYEKCAKYLMGFYSMGNKKLYVSRGIGTSHIPFRLFCRPELVVLHFTS